MANNSNKSWWEIQQPKIKQASLSALRFLAGSTVYYILLTIAVLIVAWMLWVNVWQPLQEEAGLPGNLSGQNPGLQEELVQGINDGRRHRLEYRAKSYNGYQRLFNPLPSVSPTPTL